MGCAVYVRGGIQHSSCSREAGFGAPPLPFSCPPSLPLPPLIREKRKAQWGGEWPSLSRFCRSLDPWSRSGTAIASKLEDRRCPPSGCVAVAPPFAWDLTLLGSFDGGFSVGLPARSTALQLYSSRASAWASSVNKAIFYNTKHHADRKQPFHTSNYIHSRYQF